MGRQTTMTANERGGYTDHPPIIKRGHHRRQGDGDKLNTTSTTTNATKKARKSSGENTVTATVLVMVAVAMDSLLRQSPW